MTKGGRRWRELSLGGEDGGVGSSRSRTIFPFPLFLLSSADWGGDQEAPLGRYGSLWVAAGDAGRGWKFFFFFL